GVRQLVAQRWPEAEIGEASCLAQALEQARGTQWDIALLDLSMPDTSGLEGLVRLHRAAPGMRVLVLSMHDEAAYAARALQLGAAGYLTKEHATSELVAAIERVRGGQRYISADLAARLADLLSGEAPARAPHETLSAQEHRVMLLIAAGRSASEIAEAMHLSVKTVGTYRSRIIDKTGLANTAEIARYCAQHGLVDAS
ncbi:MAG: response regulator transcription factor, partial [Thauera sp.]